MTTIYLMRHSKALNFDTEDDYQIRNEKFVLSVEGERLAQKVAEQDEFKDLDLVVASNYVRSIGTAKYFLNDKSLFVSMKEFGERKFGVNSYREIPDDFYEHQYKDIDYHLGNGESRGVVQQRMRNGLDVILKKAVDKNVLIVSHGTAMSFLLCDWCQSKGDLYTLFYQHQLLIDHPLNNCDYFKLTFNHDQLVDIKYYEVKKDK